MRAYTYTRKDTMALLEAPIPEPGENDVLVKVAGCGVCGTDIHIYRGEVPLARPPRRAGPRDRGHRRGIRAGCARSRPRANRLPGSYHSLWKMRILSER
ncbi:MAG: alcohol dehydrogenase catalytic domain-containing protein [Bacteroidota bacterium]